MKNKALLNSINFSSGSHVYEFLFEEKYNGDIILVSEPCQEDLLPPIIKIVLNPEGETKGGFITLPKKRTIEDDSLAHFKQSFKARELSFLMVKVDEKKIDFNFKVNIYRENL